MRTFTMGRRFFYLLTLLFLSACGGGENTEQAGADNDKTIEELYADFKSSDDYQKSIAFDEKIQKIIDTESKMTLLPANQDGLANVQLDFQKNTMAGAYYAPTFIGMKETLQLGNQDGYENFMLALNEGIDKYEVAAATKKGRISSWDYVSTVFPNMISNSEYYVLMIVKKCNTPKTFDDNTFQQGEFAARVVIVDTKTSKRLGSFDIEAQNKESLMFVEGQFLKELRTDLENKINEAFIGGLKEHLGGVTYKERQEPYLKIIY